MGRSSLARLAAVACFSSFAAAQFTFPSVCKTTQSLTGASGTLKHPAGSGNYANNEEGCWFIGCDSEVQLQWNAFATESGYDKVTVSRVVAGSGLQEVLQTSGSGPSGATDVETQFGVLVQFSSDVSVTAAGFTVSWTCGAPSTTQPPACQDVTIADGNGGVRAWYDADGPQYTCGWYSSGSRCSQYGGQYSNDGYTANTACCVCGGGATGVGPYLQTVATREEFESLATSSSVPGAQQVLEVKFVVMGIQTSNPQLYFMNTNLYKYHYDFVRDGLGLSLSLSQFNADTYFDVNRKNVAGTILAHDQYVSESNVQGLYTMEFWPTDPVPRDVTAKTYQLISQRFAGGAGRLAHFPVGAAHLAEYEAHKGYFEAEGVRVVLSDELFGAVTFTALNEGVGYGTLRVIETGSETFSVRDVVIFKAIPNDLSHVGGIITDGPQTPLSHINLKAKQNNMPNAYIKDASSTASIMALLGKVVRYEVTGQGYELREATQAEADAWLESVRPTQPQTPLSDLTATEPARLTAIGHNDLVRYGAKAANVAELAKVLQRSQVPDGYAVPFSMYDEYMSAKRCQGVDTDPDTGMETPNGEYRKLCASPTDPAGRSFYEQIAALMELPEFKNDPPTRDAMLKAFRKEVKKGEVPAGIVAKLNTVHDFWRNTDGTMTRSVRLRSSTNNEDLAGFNGAGLYESNTHHPDEGLLAESVKKVWAGLWTFRAYEERDFYRIDHFKTYMGVLAHESYGEEQANGVGVTKNIYNPGTEGHYVNAQYGEISVTNPEPITVGGQTVNSIPDEFLLAKVAGENSFTWIQQYVRHSNVETVYGKPVPTPDVLTAAEVTELREAMTAIQQHFKVVYNAQSNDAFAMDIEFKITRTTDDSRGHFEVKQARPWVD